MKIKYFKAQSPAWIEARTNYITGTEMAILFNYHKYGSMPKLIKSKTGELVKEFSDNPYMRAGRLLEPAVILAVEEIGLNIKAAAKKGEVAMIINEDLKISSSLDALVKKGDKQRIVECKTCHQDKFDAFDEAFPIEYYLQVQTQMMISGDPNCLMAVMAYIFPFPLKIYQIKADRDLQSKIVDTVQEWWTLFNTGAEKIPFKRDLITPNIEMMSTFITRF